MAVSEEEANSQEPRAKEPKAFIAEGVELVGGGMSSTAAARFIMEREKAAWSIDSFRQRIAMELKNQNSRAKSQEIKIKKELTEKINKNEAKPFVLSAWDFDSGMMMDIDEYCEKYRLPRQNVLSYKLVTHTGTPYYNTLFKDVNIISSIISNDFIEKTIKKYIEPVDISEAGRFDPELISGSEWFDRVVYTDAHIGMNTDKDGIAMYASPWNKDEQMKRAAEMVREIVQNRSGLDLYLDELGDFMDGWDGLTTRGGHVLPQNMSNEQAFDVGVAFKMYLIDNLMPYYDKIHIHNICNDNHAGAFGYVVNSAVKMICDAKYGGAIEIVNQRQFINYYTVGKHAFVTTHGKDSKSLKFGFKPKLDAVQIEKIDAFLKHNKIYHQADFIEFSKGDSHQMLFDYCTSDDFDYFNYPAFAPASEWVQTNFKKSRSGFVIQNVMYGENVKRVTPYWF